MKISKRHRRFGKIVFAVFVMVGIAYLVIPSQQTVAPEWSVTVVDEKGVRLANLQVRETWQQRSIEAKPHEELLTTDAHGVVVFPRRTMNASYLSRALGCWEQWRKPAAQGSCGPYAEVWAFGRGLGTMDADDVREARATYIHNDIALDQIADKQTSMILLHHCPPGRFGAGCSMPEEYVPTRGR